MKVYRCIAARDYVQKVFHLGITLHDPPRTGDLYVEPKGKRWSHILWKGGEENRQWQSYACQHGYPKSRDFVENNPDLFEFLFDDENPDHDTEYYIGMKYSQYDVDEMIRKINETK